MTSDYFERERLKIIGFQSISAKITSLSSLDCPICRRMCVMRIASERAGFPDNSLQCSDASAIYNSNTRRGEKT